MVNEPTQAESQEEDQSGFSFMMWMALFAGGAVLLIVVIFLIGFGISLLSPTDITATRIGLIRDVLIILMALVSVFIVVALVVLVLQIARLAAMLQDESKPIMTDIRETVDTAKGTAKFVSQNVTRPIINLSAFMTGVMAFAREFGGIRRVIRKNPKKHKKDSNDGAS